MRECTPLNKKVYLNPQEAIELYSLSARKFYRLIKNDQVFLGSYNKRKIIVRTAFEDYLKEPGNMEALARELPSRPDYARRMKEGING